ncbi:MAG: hypothetical protein QNK04_24675 [Myxococcota bacterium]|nr:hypothetical protein [Myxococcota bacterium]
MTRTSSPDAGIPSVRQRAVLVVGAGRSGTSAVTRGVQALGVELGQHLRAATGKNPTGFFEDRDLLRIAKRVRSRLGLRSESVSLVDDARWRLTDLSDLRKEAVDVVHRHFRGAPVWGFKYSQTLRYLPFWEGVLREAEVAPSFVVSLRSPLSVARSRAKLDRARGVQEKSDLEWLVNVVPWFRRMAAHPTVVADFDLLLDEPEVQLRRLAKHLDLPVDEPVEDSIRSYARSFLKGEMRHTRFDPDRLGAEPRLNPITRDAYLLLRRLATDEVSLESARFWQEWSRIEAAVEQLAPVLGYVDRLEAELRSSRRKPVLLLRKLLTRRPRRSKG